MKTTLGLVPLSDLSTKYILVINTKLNQSASSCGHFKYKKNHNYSSLYHLHQ